MNQNKDNPDTESFKKIVALYLVLDLLQRSKAGSLLQESLLSPSSDENFVCWFVFLIFFFPESSFLVCQKEVSMRKGPKAEAEEKMAQPKGSYSLLSQDTNLEILCFLRFLRVEKIEIEIEIKSAKEGKPTHRKIYSSARESKTDIFIL